MGLFSDNIGLLAASSSGAGVDLGHPIENSCRFNDDDTAYLSRTFGSGNRKTWTFSAWIKLGNLDINYRTLFADNSGNAGLYFSTSNTLDGFFGAAGAYPHVGTRVFRDPSAWYHICLRIDTTQATAGDRIRLYINNVLETWASASTPPQNTDLYLNQAVQHNVGKFSASLLFDGYMAEVVFIDGQALDPTSFGEFNSIGMWVPKNVSGLTYGTNGFHLDFADSGDIGNDVSGNGNDFTPNNLVAGDILSDTPTNNFATLSSIDKGAGAGVSDGNLHYAAVGVDDQVRATIHPTTGKWYWEANANPDCLIGISLTTDPNTNFPGESVNSRGWYGASGAWFQSGSAGGTWATYTSSDVLGFALDSDAGTCAVYKNNVLQGTWTSVQNYVPVVGRSSGIADFNFGQSAFAYTPPAGFQSLCTENLGTPTIADPSAHFDVALYTGNGTAIGSGGNEISDLSFQPDLVWIKNRDAADQHILTDAVRGATKYLSPDGADIEATEAETLASFDTDGFTVGNDVQVNTNTEDYVAWCWKAGGSGSVNGDGTISSTVSVNTTAGFSIVKYVGNGTGGATVGHGLGAVPGLIIVKNLDQADSWAVYHAEVASDPETDYLVLDTSAAAADLNTLWNDTAPTTTVFSVGTSHLVNASTENYVAYCFSEVDGFSRFGSYTGNGSADGPFVWCGFRPSFLIIKPVASSTNGWYMLDSERSPINQATNELFAGIATAEVTNFRFLDILSNGFKLRSQNVYAEMNPSGGRVIFIAFAEHPFAYARAR